MENDRADVLRAMVRYMAALEQEAAALKDRDIQLSGYLDVTRKQRERIRVLLNEIREAHQMIVNDAENERMAECPF